MYVTRLKLLFRATQARSELTDERMKILRIAARSRFEAGVYTVLQVQLYKHIYKTSF
jgi:hypothetical protein